MNASSLFVELDKSIHDRKTFDCGEDELNRFFQQSAAKHRKLGISQTMVLPSTDDESTICAWYTLTHVSMERNSLPAHLVKRLPGYPVPLLLIAQLAVHVQAQGQGLGKLTLTSALKHAYSLRLQLPSWAVVVDALNDSAQSLIAICMAPPKQPTEAMLRTMRCANEMGMT